MNVLLGIVAVVAAGNLAILGATGWARRRRRDDPAPALTGIRKLRVVDDRVWRGAAPTPVGYRSLAAAGVGTVVDLRAEAHVHVDLGPLDALGLERLHLPVRDGQVPSPAAVERFLRIVADARTTVFLHCGAGVGRTGSMAAAYLVATGRARARAALERNLAVGPPSLEQIAWVLRLRGREVRRVHPAVVALSRVLDAPRRAWARLRQAGTKFPWKP